MDIGEAKKQYKILAFKYHPDVGGSVAEMQQVNNEYEEVVKLLANRTGKKYSVDYDYMDIVEQLIKMNLKNCIIEICGWFIYVTGDTKVYKDLLKKAGLLWHSKKLAWYWRPEWYVKKDNKIWSMDKIRQTFGSEIVANSGGNNPTPELN
jgi:hypothetical protein